VITSILVCLLLQAPSPELDGEQMLRILEGLHSGIHDFELVCEGRVTWADPELREKSEDPKRLERIFQGSYAYRAADGASYLDLYEKPLDSPTPTLLHSTHANLKGIHADIVRSADRRNYRPGFATQRGGGPGVLTFPCSPERFIYLYRWSRVKYSVANKTYKAEGWEEIDGNVALRVWVDEFPKGKRPDRIWSRYWIDMKRGGHVVKHEYHAGNQLRFRLYDVVLANIESPDGTARWFPVHADWESFLWKTEWRATPVLHESYDVVRGSLVFNRGLTDDRFSLDWKGRTAESPALQKTRQEYNSVPVEKPAQVRTGPQMRTDPAGVEEDLKKQLAEADRQAEQLDASSRRGWWNSSTLAQGGMTAFGVGILAAAFFLRRRLS